MAMEQPATLRVVSGGQVVEAEWMPSGVPGLALAGRPLTTGWRLVHIASGRAVSRSAEDPDPEAVRALAVQLASLGDWTVPNMAATVPGFREGLDRALGDWRATHPELSSPTELAIRPEIASSPPAPADAGPGPGLDSDADLLMTKLRDAEDERALLREVVRLLHTTFTPNAFADALATLDRADRDLVFSLVDDAEDTTAVVQAIHRSDEVVPSRPVPATARTSSTPRTPVRPRMPHMPGRGVAAS